MRTVKQLAIEKTMLQQFAKLILTQNYSALLAFSYTCIWGPVPAIITAIYWRALVLIENGKMTADGIIIVFAFSNFAMLAIRNIAGLIDYMGSSLSAAQNFFDLFDRISAIDSSSTEGQKLIDVCGDIEFDRVDFFYPSRPQTIILKKFCLSIKSGQNLALVGMHLLFDYVFQLNIFYCYLGESGCGKSTIIQLLQRFYDVSHGQVRLDNVDIRNININSLRSYFGLVSQEPILFNLTIAENIAYAQENISMEAIIEAATEANIHQFIQQLPMGYETKVGMKGNLLSGGEKQRIAIARAFLRQPKILLLDEATSAIDVYNEQIVQKVLEEARIKDANRTTLTIVHRISTIRSCDPICVLHAGHLIESGHHDDLMQRQGAYYGIVTSNSSQN
ncbi:unnamed protein product [Rotaria sp. Silwood2]|nr:unnamed protein product [Rotaria sp. Silwood2]CAF4280086.1 unnamed protein product [Rotaria sp. Silwood2]